MLIMICDNLRPAINILLATLAIQLMTTGQSVCELINYDKIGKHYNMTDKQILDKLITPDKYDHRMRPEAKTVVNMSLLILTLTSPDESSVTYEIGFVMMQKWYDPRLKFEIPKELEDKASSIYLNGLNHADRIWIPDLYYIKHGEFKHQNNHFDPLHITLKIFANGTVLYTTQRNMILTCEGNLKIFPFDSPKCFFAIESISHEEDQIELKWDVDVAMQASDSLKTINAYMVRNQTNRCNKRHTWRREFSCLSVLLVFSRDQSFYLSTVFVPGMVLVTSSFISFWLDVNAVPARVMISVTTMLNFCTTTNNFRSKLPVVSNLNAMNLWDFVCMFFIYASMIEFIIVNYIYRKGDRGKRNPNRASFRRQSVSSQSENQSFRNKSLKKFNRKDLVVHCQSNQDNCELKTPLSIPEEAPPIAVTNLNRTESYNRLDGIHSEHNRGAMLNNSNYQLHEEGMSVSQMKKFFVDWIRKPYLINADNYSSNVQMARSIDHISKTVFTLLFGLFSFFYFLTYAFIKPAQLEDWIEKEFEAVD